MLEGGPRGCTTYLADTQPYSCLIPSTRNDENSAFREGDSGVTHHEHSQIQLLRMSFWKSKSRGGHRGFVLYSSVRPAAQPAQEWVGEPGGWWDTAEYLGTVNDPFLDMPASWHACGWLKRKHREIRQRSQSRSIDEKELGQISALCVSSDEIHGCAAIPAWTLFSHRSC